MKTTIKTKKVAPVSRRITFQLAANPKSDIFLAGTFNNWDCTRHRMKDTRTNGKYTITLVLPKGQYEYKFLVNGNWLVDPECQNWVRNSYGTLNSLLTVE
ncbi:MAG: isoamylase early set domain-containing protein [Kiritimatiellia bacterium]